MILAGGGGDGRKYGGVPCEVIVCSRNSGWWECVCLAQVESGANDVRSGSSQASGKLRKGRSRVVGVCGFGDWREQARDSTCFFFLLGKGERVRGCEKSRVWLVTVC